MEMAVIRIKRPASKNDPRMTHLLKSWRAFIDIYFPKVEPCEVPQASQQVC
jgi:hypothetical protein